MAHAVSATYLRFDHMSPTAAAMALALHVLTALAIWWVSPLNRKDIPEEAIEVTIEQPAPPQATPEPPPPPAPPTSPPAAAGPPPPAPTQHAPLTLGAPPPPPPKPTQAPQDRLGVAPAKPAEPPKPPVTEPPKQEPAKPEPQQALAPQEPPKAPPAPPLEKTLPPVEAPPPPLNMQDFVKLAPPPSTVIKPPPTPPPLRAPQQPQASPLNNLQQQRPQQAAPSGSGATATFVNPATTYTRTRAQDDYLWQVIHKFSQYLPNLRAQNEGGTVVIRMVIARDGRLLDASITHSSGVAALDRGMLESVRVASPYPPLPADIPGDQIVFVQPITAKR
jgi:TonB family protein